MGSIADRNRDLLIARLERDPRLAGEDVLAAAALMRVSVFAAVAAGVAGAVLGQVFFGEGSIQFALGMAAGYLGYFGYLAVTMKEPRAMGAMAALTPQRIVLLGSRKRGVVADYPISTIESLEMVRRGNLLMMGKLVVKTAGNDPVTFLTTNRRLAVDFVERFDELASGRAR